PFQRVAVRNNGPKQGRVGITKTPVFEDFANRLARSEQPFKIKTRTPIRKASNGTEFLGRDIHQTEPMPGEDPMFFNLQQIRLFTGILKKKPPELLIVVGNETVIAKLAPREVREHVFVDRAFRPRRRRLTPFGDHVDPAWSDAGQPVNGWLTDHTVEF